MSILKLTGKIKTNPENQFAYFSMKVNEVKNIFSETIEQINRNMQLKNIDGFLTFCSFEAHAGTI